MNAPHVLFLSDANRETIVRAHVLQQELGLPISDGTAKPHEADYRQRQADGFSWLRLIEDRICQLGRMASYIPDLDTPASDGFTENDSIERHWVDLEALSVLASRTHAIAIVRAQELEGMTRQLLEMGSQRAALWSSLSEADRRSLFEDHAAATGDEVSYQMAA